MTHLLKVAKKRSLELALTVIVRIEGLEDLVQTFVKVSPKVLKWSEVPDTFADVCRIVIIGFDRIGAVKLGDDVIYSYLYVEY
jgi:hypothetical protein